MRRYVFYVVLWALAAAPVLIIVSVVVESGIAYQVLQHPKRGETSFRLWNGIATDLYYLYDANIWQNIRECVQYDETLLYKPSSGCFFNNREYSAVLIFFKDGRGNARVGDYSKTAIVFVGDSDTMGWGVNDDETFAYLVGAALGVPVFNLGVSSYGTARELLCSRQNYGFLLAKCIVIQYNFNDFDENWGFVNAGALPSHSYADFEWLISYRRRKATFVDVLQRTTQYFVHFPIHFLADLFNLRMFPWRLDLIGGKQKLRNISDDAKVFIRALQHFPELNYKKIIVIGPDDFVLALKQTSGREGLIILDTATKPSDWYTLDKHRNRKGHRRLAKHMIEFFRTDTGRDCVHEVQLRPAQDPGSPTRAWPVPHR